LTFAAPLHTLYKSYNCTATEQRVEDFGFVKP